ncbi:hypothetical protein Q765_03295 [Flavobacterium rivuli WB 3.3-2 = DSM 21788]|uniref:ATP-dependent Clp protease proteolytic subunit n=1 Tax=Flavobacterium rivuli WB 3.3-2 = DSM 21788 TaxID=1121895 RepID=A0A0A2M9I5_9FLAO|nr:Clp protease ClpP [Flavobacterium rivuli]KGO88093.1 hypothetical protein Q765_03295 [Flavobacterium rivuli WB 3.3-2 = DSM 21788]
MIGNIYISGQIGTFDGVAGVELIDIVSQVKKQPEATHFNVHINSDGGLVDVGFDIYDYLVSLQASGIHITTIGSGIVASIATIIFMAGSVRQVRVNTPFMIHLPWGGTTGNSDTLAEFTDRLRVVEKKMTGFYMKVLSLDESALLPLLKNETWLTMEQLYTLGFTTTEPILAVAKAVLTNINTNTMESLTDKDKSFISGLFDKVLGKIKKPDILNKVVQDATGAELNFTDLEKDAAIEVGAKATFDNKPADGDYTMPDGTVYKFDAGELKEIVSPDEETLTPEQIAELIAERDSLKEENEQLKTETTAAQAQLQDIEKDVTQLKAQVTSKFDLSTKKDSKKIITGADRTAGMKAYLESKKQ